ncbi:GGDEF domain-containing protein [Geodermatophilus sabuli]|uniref:Diguanylate cyclase (GGDEF) domain-containing protein n=1 Tax=Geodermatophilus sabuli TaxID=1564158 RepID=A0A285EI31_9ACTN|nr:GGDEF domain-containing protein [Geodermatophilus sabuli]MBB3086854.1 diguanylate cyclase (GGDEF)-like protein [Geodermatophilus sabuli]SNX98772.1 diguanylate cyclase (GGDEF) domain-containing protein [Geodermatophilus sabuli]
MQIPAALRAREPRAAARTAAAVLTVCAAMLTLVVLTGPLGPDDASRSVLVSCVVGLLVVAAGYARIPPQLLDRVGAFLGLAVVGVTVLTALSLASGSSSTRVQAFLAFVVVYAGFHLRTAGAVVATVVAVASGGVMFLHERTFHEALTDLLFFGAMLAVIGGLLTRAVSAQDRLVAALQRQADVDSLTGLVTRRVLDEALDVELSGGCPGDGTALVLVDVDSFKQINDVHGHPVGDDALVHLAGVLRRQVRAGDAVISRLGGDELAVLLPGCAPGVAVRRAEEILEAVHAAPLTLPDGSLLSLSVSVGVAHAPQHATRMRELYAAADAALYQAKRAGRGRVEVAVSPA